MSDLDSFEVHFLDVGQASSSVVLYNNVAENNRREAVVIDCAGDKTGVLGEVLENYVLNETNGGFIAALILTHNDRDHAGGAAALIHELWKRRRIGKIFLVNDRAKCTARLRKSLMRTKRMSPRFIESIDFLYLGQDQRPKVLHRAQIRRRGATVEELTIESLAPTMGEAFFSTGPNAASGVIRLSHDGRSCVLFCGDNSGAAWRRIYRDQGRIACEAILVPHHGGPFKGPRGAEGWFFQEAVEAKQAIFSFGASNSYEHPSAEVVHAAIDSGATTLFTQVTPLVYGMQLDSPNDARKPPLKSGVVTPTAFSLSGVEPKKPRKDGRRPHIACAGTISVRFGPAGAVWGHQGDSALPCGFHDLDELRAMMLERCPLARDEAQLHRHCAPRAPVSGA